MFTGYVVDEGWICVQQTPDRRWRIDAGQILGADNTVICEVRDELTPAVHRWRRIYTIDQELTEFYLFHGYVYGPTADVPWARVT
jgi:hypothetical protein